MTEPGMLVAGTITCATLLMIVKTIAKAVTHGTPPRDLANVLEQFDQQTAVLDDTRAAVAAQANQLAELQERLDFAERMLAQGPQRTSLGPGEPRA